MKALFFIFRRVWGPQWKAFGLGLLLSVVVLCAGIALLALSGWFITAAGLAGAAGFGITFDVFRPSAGVRLFAFGRAAARYGERLTTHDATLRGLASLRTLLTAAFFRMPIVALQRLRGSERLNLMTVDVDSLDGLALRLVLPLAAALVTLALATLVLVQLTTVPIVLWQIASLLTGILSAAALSFSRSKRPSRRARHAMQKLRTRIIEMRRGQTELVTAGALADWRGLTMLAQDRLQSAQSELEQAGRLTNLVMSLVSSLAGAGALVLGAIAVDHQALGAAEAAIGFFASLALLEVGAPLVRGVSELGQMSDAARRMRPLLEAPANIEDQDEPTPAERPPSKTAVLAIRNVTVSWNARVIVDGISLDVNSGETVALTGESGKGKSTILQIARGLITPEHGTVLLGSLDIAESSDAARAGTIGYLPQRTSFLRGTVRDNLLLAKQDASDEDMQNALRLACLEDVIVEKGGLDATLGEAGAGLSGGEHRRLALARVMLSHPSLLLLDEPTEGLDDETAHQVLLNIRHALPDAAILVAAHKSLEKAWAGRIVALP